jgi:hypothetical protein
VIDWQFGGSLRKLVDRDDAKLLIVIEDVNDEYAVMALETSKQAIEGGGEAVLDDHSHKVVGYYPTVRQALDAADSFGGAWARRFKATRSDKCDCAPIEASASSTPRRGSRRFPSARA